MRGSLPYDRRNREHFALRTAAEWSKAQGLTNIALKGLKATPAFSKRLMTIERVAESVVWNMYDKPTKETR